MKETFRQAATAAVIVGVTIVGWARGETGKVEPTPPEVIKVRQDRIAKVTRDLEELIENAALQEQAAHPEDAKRLREAAAFIRQGRLAELMQEITRNLGDRRLDTATAEQAKVIELLRTLRQIIEPENKLDMESFHKEIARLKAILPEIKKLRASQEALEKETSGKTKPGDVEGLTPVQIALREKADNLKNEMNPTGDPNSSKPTDPSSNKPGDPNSSKPGDPNKSNPADPAKPDEPSKIARLPDDSTKNTPDGSSATPDDPNNTSPTDPPDASPNESAENKPEDQPGATEIAKAGQAMGKAAGDMQKGNGAGASDQQETAIRNLKKAEEEIEKRLQDLMRTIQDETLADLESQFRRMLADQEKTTAATAALAKSQPEGELSRAKKIECLKQGQAEASIAEFASKVLLILRDDGTTVVLPQIVGQLHEDLTETHKRLESLKADQYTQLMQQGIEATLRELIEVVSAQRDKNRSTPPTPPNPPDEGNKCTTCPPELVNKSAELKLLKNAQTRINTRTARFEEARRSGDGANDREFARLALEQEKLAEMTRKIAEK